VFKTKDGWGQECQDKSVTHLLCLTSDPQQSCTLIKNDQLINLHIIQSHSFITASQQSHHKDNTTHSFSTRKLLPYFCASEFLTSNLNAKILSYLGNKADILMISLLHCLCKDHLKEGCYGIYNFINIFCIELANIPYFTTC
jgi:hypothetical protein